MVKTKIVSPSQNKLHLEASSSQLKPISNFKLLKLKVSELSLIHLFLLHSISNQSENSVDSTFTIVPELKHFSPLLLLQHQRPSLDHCNGLLAGLPKCTVAPKQTVFKTLSVIFLKCESNHVNFLLKTLQCFTIH